MPKAKLLHQETSVTPLTLGFNHRGFHNELHKKYTAPLSFKDSFVVYENYQIDWCGDFKKFTALGKKVIDNVKKDPTFSRRLFADTKKVGDKLERECKKINKLNLEDLSNTRIANLINTISALAYKINDYGLVAVFSDLRHNMLTDILKNIVEIKISKYHLAKSENYYLSTLITINKTTYSQRERKAFLAIAKDIESKPKLQKMFSSKSPEDLAILLKKSYPKIYAKLNSLRKKYEWLVFGHVGPAKSLEQYIEDIKNVLPGKLLEKELLHSENENQKIKDEQRKITKELHLNSDEKNLFRTARDFSYNKAYRFEILIYTLFTLDKLLREISKRQPYSVKELRFMTPEEIIASLRGKKTVTREEVHKRQRYCVAVVKGKKCSHLSDKKGKAYVRSRIARTVINKKLTKIHGNTAYPGQVTGTVKIVNSKDDIGKIEPGDILISIQTNPDLVPAMKKAAGFVTDVGGITSHAAIIARELKKPCVIGTKVASKILKDGFVVKVNANEGAVIIKKRD